MKKFNFASKYIRDGKVSFQRFPVAMTFACLFALVAVYSNHQTQDIKSVLHLPTSTALMMVLVLGFFLALAINLADKSIHKLWVKASGSARLILYILGLGILVAMYLTLRPIDLEQQTRGLIYTYSGILLATIVACSFLGRLSTQEDFEAYVAAIIYSEILALIYTIVLFGGLGAVLFAINYLMGIKISSTIYTDLFFILFGPVQAGFFLAAFPEDTMVKSNKDKTPFTFILKKIVTPVLLIYTGILYLYFIKMFAKGEIPSNLIRNLFIWYGLVSVISLFFHSSYMDEKISRWMVTRYSRLALTTILVYLYALYLRIQDVGITEARYLGLVFGIYVALSLIVLVWQEGRDNRTLAIILVIFLLLSSVGPQSMTAVSKRSQEKRLVGYLLSNDMLSHGKIVPKKKLKEEDKREITSIVNYLATQHNPAEVKYLPKDFTMDRFDQLFGFPPEYYNGTVTTEEEASSPGIDYYSSEYQEALDIRGYDKYYLLNFSNIPEGDKEKLRYFSIKEDQGNLVISKKDGDLEVLRIPLKEISGKYKALTNGRSLQNPNDFAFEGKTKDFDYRLVITSLSVDQEEKNYYIEMALLTTERD